MVSEGTVRSTYRGHSEQTTVNFRLYQKEKCYKIATKSPVNKSHLVRKISSAHAPVGFPVGASFTGRTIMYIMKGLISKPPIIT